MSLPLWAHSCRAELPPTEDVSSLSPVAILKRAPFLSMVAMMAILDPPREEAIHAAEAARNAGITVKMITGDCSHQP
jgi:magnesium-transporting ATPase (P-type)